jgi:hypothetical protein
MLRALEDVQRQIAMLRRVPLPSPFHGATEFVRATTNFLPMAAIAFAAFVLLSKQPERRS